MGGFTIKGYLNNIFNKNDNEDITSFQESDPRRQKIYDNMNEEQKKKYIERKVRDIKYISKRQFFLNIIIEELDKENSEENFENIMRKISKVYGNTQMIDIFSYQHYYHLKGQQVITPLFELLDDCYNVNNDEIKERLINWLFNKSTRKDVKWDIIIGLCHCEYVTYDTIDRLINLIDKYIEPVENGVLSNDCLDKLSSLIIPTGYSMAGQSFLGKWVSLSRDFKDYESLQKIINAGFKIQYKAFGKDEVLLNSPSEGLLQLDINSILEKIDRFLMENSKNDDQEFLHLKELRQGYKHSLIHKMFLSFSEKDSDFLLENKIIPDTKDILFFDAITRKIFKNKKIMIFLDELLPGDTPIYIRLKRNVSILKEFLEEEDK